MFFLKKEIYCYLFLKIEQIDMGDWINENIV